MRRRGIAMGGRGPHALSAGAARLLAALLLALSCTPRAAAQTMAEREETTRRMFREGEYRAVVDTFARVSPDSLAARTLVDLGSAQALLGDHQGAIRSLRAAAEREPERIAYRYQLGRTMAEAGLQAGAALEFEKILTRDSSHVPALTQLGRLRFEDRSYREASSLFLRALRLNPRDFLGNYYLGWTYHNLGELDSAALFLAVSQTLNPSFVPSAALLAGIRFRQERYAEALRLYRHATVQQPGNPDLWMRLGLCYQKVENPLEARLCHERACALDSTNAIAWAYLGQALYDLKLYDSAAVAFERGVELDDSNPALLLNLGLALAKRGSPREAVAALQMAVEAYGPGEIARAHREIGAVYFLEKDYARADAAYRRALQYNGADPVARFYLAVSLDQRKEYKAALTQYRKYLTVSRDDPARARNEKSAKERIAYLKTLP